MTIDAYSPGEFAIDIDICQYRRMPKSLTVLDPAGLAGCCPPLAAEPLSRAQAEQVAPLLKALAEPVRLRLMSLVASHPGGEACVCDLTGAFDLSQPTISHHLKVLHEAGLISAERRGTWVYYRINPQVMARMSAVLVPQPALSATAG